METNVNISDVHYDPEVPIKDVADWMNWTTHTARRRMKVMKQRLGIAPYVRPTKSQVLAYFQIER